MTTAPFPDEIIRARVSMISPTIDPRTRTLRVRAELPNPDGRIRPGLFAHIDLGVDERPGVLMVPEDAVVQRADGAVIFRLVESDRVERLQIETGAYEAGWVEIKNLLRPSDLVVVRGQSRIEDGIYVAVRRADGQPADVAADESASAKLAVGDAP